MAAGEISEKDQTRLAEFFDYLEREGFAAGPGERVRACLVFAKANRDYRKRRLKTLLCPIFARNEEDQRRFHNAYDLFFRAEELSGAPSTPLGQTTVKPPEGAPPFNVRKWRRLGVAALAACVALGAIEYFDLLRKARDWVRPPTHHTTQSSTSTPPSAPPKTTTRQSTKEGTKNAERACAGWECVSEGPRPWIIVSPMAAWLILLALARTAHWQRYRTLRRERSRTPPFEWAVVTAPPPEFALEPRLRATAQALRRRISGDLHEIDVPATLDATVRTGGYPSIHFRKSAKTPEYVFLIEERSERDHLAAWHLSLASALASAQVAVDVFTYRGDPRRVYPFDTRRRALSRRRGKAGVNLRHLLARSRGASIAVFGSGSELLHPYKGHIAAWSESLIDEDRCVVFTPAATFEWGEKEQTLSRAIPTLPSRVYALPLALPRGEWQAPALGLIRQEEATESAAPPESYLREAEAEAAGEPPSLALFLDKTVFEWLCACAVHPVLDWNLTLHLAKVVDAEGRGAALYNERSILQLARLKWFREGEIPGEWRAWLIRCLPAEKLRRVRAFLIAEMRETPAPAGSFAADERAVQIAAQEYWLNPGPATRAALERELQRLPESDVARDPLLEKLRQEWNAAPVSVQAIETVRMTPRRLVLGWRLAVAAAVLAVIGYMVTSQLLRVRYQQKVVIPVVETVSAILPPPAQPQIGVLRGTVSNPTTCSGATCILHISSGQRNYDVTVDATASVAESSLRVDGGEKTLLKFFPMSELVMPFGSNLKFTFSPSRSSLMTALNDLHLRDNDRVDLFGTLAGNQFTLGVDAVERGLAAYQISLRRGGLITAIRFDTPSPPQPRQRIQISGNKSFSTQELLKQIGAPDGFVPQGDLASVDVLVGRLRLNIGNVYASKLLTFYRGQGFLDAQVNHNGDTSFNIQEGARWTVSGVSFAGMSAFPLPADGNAAASMLLLSNVAGKTFTDLGATNDGAKLRDFLTKYGAANPVIVPNDELDETNHTVHVTWTLTGGSAGGTTTTTSTAASPCPPVPSGARTTYNFAIDSQGRLQGCRDGQLYGPPLTGIVALCPDKSCGAGVEKDGTITVRFSLDRMSPLERSTKGEPNPAAVAVTNGVLAVAYPQGDLELFNYGQLYNNGPDLISLPRTYHGVYRPGMKIDLPSANSVSLVSTSEMWTFDSLGATVRRIFFDFRSTAGWTADQGELNKCSPPNPRETGFKMASAGGLALSAESTQDQCCGCTRRGKGFAIPNGPVSVTEATLSGTFNATREGSTYGVGSFQVDVMLKGERVGYGVYATENRPNDNCALTRPERLVSNGGSFSIALSTIASGQFDTIRIWLQGYACGQADVSAALADVSLGIVTAGAP